MPAARRSRGLFARRTQKARPFRPGENSRNPWEGWIGAGCTDSVELGLPRAASTPVNAKNATALYAVSVPGIRDFPPGVVRTASSVQLVEAVCSK